MDLVDSKYFPSIVSKTASFVERAKPDENAIFARVASTRDLGNIVSPRITPRTRSSLLWLLISLQICLGSQRYDISSDAAALPFRVLGVL